MCDRNSKQPSSKRAWRSERQSSAKRRKVTSEGHLGRCYLKGRAGDAANAILSAIGYNFRRILAWLRIIVALFLGALSRLLPARLVLSRAS
jgi:hypothetical protein